MSSSRDTIAPLACRPEGHPSAESPSTASRGGCPFPDMARLIALPRVDYDVGDDRFWTSALRLPTGTITLRDGQESCLYALLDAQGLMAGLGTGEGKSFVAILAAAALNRTHTVIIAPPATLSQLRVTLDLLRQHFDLRRQTFTFMSYAAMRKTGALEKAQGSVPDDMLVIVADEAHSISRQQSAQTRTFQWWLDERDDVVFVAMSATFLSDNPEQMASLCTAALREHSPLPLNRGDLSSLSRLAMLDVRSRRQIPATDDDRRLIRYLWDWSETAYEVFGDAGKTRRAFRERLRSCPGVVMSNGNPLECSIVIRRHERELHEELEEAITAAIQDGVTPSNEPLDSPAQASDFARRLCLGVYYERVWPNNEPDVAWVIARNRFSTMTFRYLSRHARPGMNTSSEVETAVLGGADVPPELSDAVHEWQEHKHRPKPGRRTVVLDPGPIAGALSFALSLKTPCIIWYHSTGVGMALKRLGVEVHGSGDEIDATKPRLIAAHIRVHGQGLDQLVAWQQCLVLEPPANGKAWEQMLGRTHRSSQTAASVTWWVAQYGDPQVTAYRRARIKGKLFEDLTRVPQRIMYAAHDWKPDNLTSDSTVLPQKGHMAIERESARRGE